MSDLIGGVTLLLPRLGWSIVESAILWAPYGGWTDGRRIELTSAAPPAGLRVRVIIHDEPWDQQGEVLITPVEPVRFGEVRLSPGRAEANDFRQLRRVLRWFHDPSPSELWSEGSRPDDWFPLEEWLAEAGLHGEGLDMRWPTCGDPEAMLRCLSYTGPEPSERKLRLLACALARQLPVSMIPAVNRHIVAFAEQHAEGLCPRRELKKAAKGTVLHWLMNADSMRSVTAALEALRHETPGRANVLAADAIRELFVNPFVPVTVRHVWLRMQSGAARDLVAAIVTSADYALMPVLADALEDAGCSDALVLGHARHGGPHSRGCWLLDVLRDL